MYLVNLFGMHLRVLFCFSGGLVLFDPCSFGLTMMESQGTHGKAPQGVLGLDEKHVSNNQFCIYSS